MEILYVILAFAFVVTIGPVIGYIVIDLFRVVVLAGFVLIIFKNRSTLNRECRSCHAKHRYFDDDELGGHWEVVDHGPVDKSECHCRLFAMS